MPSPAIGALERFDIGPRGAPTIEMVSQVQQGLPVRSVEELSRWIAPGNALFKYQLVSKPTLARRKAAKPFRLSKEESERIVRLSAVWNFALEVWKGDAGARRFMFDPHMLLGDRTPVEVTLSSELGGKLVEDILGRLAYGTGV